MTVYVLLKGYHYEGQSFIDVFSTLDGAKEAAQRHHLTEGDMPAKLEFELEAYQSSDRSWSAPFCNGRWTIEKCEVL